MSEAVLGSIRSHSIFRFAVVGCLNTAIDIGLFLLLVRMFPGHTAVSNVISYSAGLLNSFILNKFWTFAETSRHGPAGRQFVLFVLFNLVGLAISTGLVVALTGVTGPALAKVLSVPIVFVWGYVTNRRLVYAARPVRVERP